MTEQQRQQKQEAEETLIGLIVLNPEFYLKCCDIVDEDWFSSDVNKSIWRGFYLLSSTNTPLNPQNLVNVSKNIKLEDVISTTRHTSFQNDLNSAIDLLRSANRLSKIDLMITDVRSSFINDNDPEGALMKIDKYKTSIEQLSNKQTKFYSITKSLEVIDDDLNNDKIYGLPTGFNRLDEYIYGWRKGAMYVLGARPGMGKSALGLQLSLQLSKNMGNVLFISLEMLHDDLIRRALAQEAQIDLSKIITNYVVGDDRKKYDMAKQNLSTLKLDIFNHVDLKIESLGSLLKGYQALHGNIDLLVVDYLQLLRSIDNKIGRVEEIEMASRELKALAMSLEIPVLALAQLNRDVEKKANKEPNLSDLKGSGAIEQDADVVMLIHRNLNEESQGRDDKLLIAKNRNGRMGALPITFNSNYTSFNL